MTKFIATAALAAVAVVSVSAPRSVEAATLSASQIQAVVSLLQAFGVESSTITSVEQTLSGAQTSTSTTAVSPDIIGFYRVGSEGEGVKLLQLVLAADPSVYPEGIVSGFFGQLTEKALKRYQQKHGLEQVGFVGPKTLQRLRTALAENPIAQERSGKFCVPPGHLIAPGWLKKHGNGDLDISTCTNLPPGIAKKLGTSSTASSTDKTAPVISEIEEDSITSTSAEIEWETNEKATSVVNFGTTTSYGMSANTGSTLSTGHSVLLTGLSSATEYHYRVTSVDGSGNTATSSDQTFTTSSSSPADTTVPTISDLSVDSITATSAEVEWDTNEDTTAKVYYGTSNPLDLATASLVTSNTLDNSHDLDLTGLATSTTYFYVVVSADAANNTATSSQASFTTASS